MGIGGSGHRVDLGVSYDDGQEGRANRAEFAHRRKELALHQTSAQRCKACVEMECGFCDIECALHENYEPTMVNEMEGRMNREGDDTHMVIVGIDGVPKI